MNNRSYLLILHYSFGSSERRSDEVIIDVDTEGNFRKNLIDAIKTAKKEAGGAVAVQQVLPL